jgi:hypothetical protein
LWFYFQIDDEFVEGLNCRLIEVADFEKCRFKVEGILTLQVLKNGFLVCH